MFAKLLDFLFPPREDEAHIRGYAEMDFLMLLQPTVILKTDPATVALLPFHESYVRSAIHEAKYRGSETAFKLLGAALGDYLRGHDEVDAKSFIVPVPLGERRLRERGYNQVEEVAKRVARELALTLHAGALMRTRETASQVSLPRHLREENMRGAFGATHVFDPAHTYIVIDDVLTTGATLQAAIDALKAGGATKILPIALAH